MRSDSFDSSSEESAAIEILSSSSEDDGDNSSEPADSQESDFLATQGTAPSSKSTPKKNSSKPFTLTKAPSTKRRSSPRLEKKSMLETCTEPPEREKYGRIDTKQRSSTLAKVDDDAPNYEKDKKNSGDTLDTPKTKVVDDSNRAQKPVSRAPTKTPRVDGSDATKAPSKIPAPISKERADPPTNRPGKENSSSANARKKNESIDCSVAKVEQDVASAAAHKPRQVERNVSEKPKPTAKPKKLSFQEQVFRYMLFSYRPFSLKSLANELATTETQLSFLMLSLVDKGMVTKKTFQSKKGRSKELFWVNYASKSKEMQRAMAKGDEIAASEAELGELQRQIASVRQILHDTEKGPSNAELNALIAETETELTRLKGETLKVEARVAESNSQPDTKKQICPRRAKLQFNRMRHEWKTRKRKCMDFLEELADGMEKPPKAVIKLLELETDEMENVVLPPSMNDEV